MTPTHSPQDIAPEHLPDAMEQFRRVVEAEGLTAYKLDCISAGLGHGTVRGWLHRGLRPRLDLFERILNALGYEIVIRRKERRTAP